MSELSNSEKAAVPNFLEVGGFVGPQDALQRIIDKKGIDRKGSITLEDAQDLITSWKYLIGRIRYLESDFGKGLGQREGHSSQTGPDVGDLVNLKPQLVKVETWMEDLGIKKPEA